MKTKQVEMWAIVGIDGSYVVREERDVAEEAYEEDYNGTNPRRAIRIVLTVPIEEELVLQAVVPPQSVNDIKLEIMVKE